MDLAFREYGTGTPLIILHGLFGQSDNWNTLSKHFGDAGFRVFTVDQRNHGLSPHSEVWDYKVMANDLLKFIHKHQLIKPIILGHSMGGKTAMFFELMHPDIAQKIIIVDIAPRAYESHHDAVLKALNSVKFDEINTRKQAEEVLSRYIQDFGTKQFLLKNIYWRNPENNLMDWRFNLKIITQEYDNIGAEVPNNSSNVKALFVKGEKSHYIKSNDVEDIKNRFPNFELIEIEGAGHWIHAEKPNEFFDVVLKFIKA